MGILKAIGEIFGVVGKTVDEFHTSTEEKLEMKAKLLGIQVQVFQQAMDLEKAHLEAQRDVIVAEANSESWITRSWRPITMLTFVTLIVLISTGVMDTQALNEVPQKMWSLLEIGIGGYIASRGAEKVLPTVASALKTREEA
jgi:hypothetical protein